MSTPIFNEKFRRPSIGLTEILKKGAGGMYRERDQYVPFMFRALVIAYDTEGGKLETPDGVPDGGPEAKLTQHVVAQNGQDIGSYVIEPTRGPRNPKGSVRARILSSNFDQFIDDDSLRTYWPLFPGLANPTPGELVYVAFEDEEMLHGLWIAKVPTSDPTATANQVLMGQIIQDIVSGNKQLFGLTVNAKVQGAKPGTVINDPHRLSNLFIGTKR